MRHSKQCPKCGNRDIIEVSNDGYPEMSYKGIMTGISILSNVVLHRYICCGCGYTEEWINKGSIQKIRESRKAKPIN